MHNLVMPINSIYGTVCWLSGQLKSALVIHPGLELKFWRRYICGDLWHFLLQKFLYSEGIWIFLILSSQDRLFQHLYRCWCWNTMAKDQQYQPVGLGHPSSSVLMAWCHILEWRTPYALNYGVALCPFLNHMIPSSPPPFPMLLFLHGGVLLLHI